MPKTRTDDEQVTQHDAEEALDRAAKMQAAAEDRVRVGDIVGAAGEVGISEAATRRAFKQIEDERAALAAAEAQRARRRRKQWRKVKAHAVGLSGAVGTFGLVAVVWGAFDISSLRSQNRVVEETRAMVRTAIVRQEAVLAQWQSAPPSNERTSEIAGSGNRVYVAINRYDQAVSTYNEHASGTLSSLVVRMFHMNGRVPFSREVTAW